MKRSSGLSGLLVEDSGADARLVAELLHDTPAADVDLRHVTSLSEARTFLGSRTPDFTLIDLQLPDAAGMNGLEDIRSLATETAIIVLTGLETSGAARRALEAGADNYLQKDELSPALLWRTISFTLERKRVEAELRKNQAFLDRVLATVAEGVLIIDPSGTITYANRRAAEMHGMRVAEMEGASARDDHWNFQNPAGDRLDPEEQVFARVFATGEAVQGMEQVVELEDGSRSVLSVNGAPLRGEDGAITQAVVSVRDITEQKELQGELEHRALYDSLTELPNRGLLWDRLDHASARADRLGRSLALIFVDIDRFKIVNDSLGHVVGDQLLQTVAERLREGVRLEDSVARFGGDEFVVLVEDLASPESLHTVAERIARLFDEPFRLAGEEHPVTASIGVALRQPDGADSEEVLHRADRAMYRAKRAGATEYAFFDRDRDLDGSRRLQREAALRRGIREGEFTLYFQPIVHLPSRRLFSLEALARWRHPERGLLPPGEFIPLAEESGLIVPLGNLLFRQVCEQLGAWRDAGLNPPGVCVNLSARQLADPELAGNVSRVLEEYGVPPDAIEFEVTERLAMETTGRIEELVDRGIRFSIDDFGTGYSSLGILKRISVDSLKIDRSFVSGLGRDLRDRAIVETIVTLGRTLGMHSIAEGVETGEQVALLTELGCRRAQGYLFAHPASAEACAAWFDSGFTFPGPDPVKAAG